MTFTRIEYLTSEIMGPPEALVIESSGSARYESHTNLPEAGAAAVGTYATELTAGEIEALAAALANPPLRDLPDHWGQIASGERYKLIRVSGEAWKVEKRIGTAKPAPPRMQALVEKLDRIVLEVKRHPVRNLQLQVSHPSLESGGTFGGTITLTNPGTASVTCPNPTVMRETPGGRLSVRGWPDREQSQIHSTDIFDVDVIAVESEVPSTRTTGGLVEISAGGAVSFRIRALVPIRGGTPYVIQVLYQNTAAERLGREVMIVELYSPLIRLK